MVDDSTVESQKYKLVMVGRKLREGEDHLLVNNEGSHLITSEVFHESGEAFKEGVKRDEGAFKHYLRRIYFVIGMFVGVNIFARLYMMSFSILIYYEDYLDWLLF